MPCAKLTTRRMPKTRERPTETRKSRAESAAALSSCSTTIVGDIAPPRPPLRELLRAALGGDALTREGGEDLRHEVGIGGVLDGLHDPGRLHRLVVALAHDALALGSLVGRVLQGGDH